MQAPTAFRSTASYGTNRAPLVMQDRFSPTSESEATPITQDTIGRALQVLARQQKENGAWYNDYSGPMFLAPMYQATQYIVGQLPDPQTRDKMVAYYKLHQNKDGGIGLHEDGDSCVFTTVLTYVAQRLIGLPKDTPHLVRQREYFITRGGAVASASWGKLVLSLLNLHEYEGLFPTPPEMWLLPKALPVHPSRLWCHCRMVYLPMAYFYGRQSKTPLTPLLEELRSEIYTQPYETIDWVASRTTIAEADNYTPHNPISKMVMRLLAKYEKHTNTRLRNKAIDFVLDQIRYEDKITSFICIGPVNKVYNTLVWHFENPDGPELKKHLEKLPTYLSEDETGIRMNGYNSSELWDLAFALQAIHATKRGNEIQPAVERAYVFLDEQQVREDPPNREKYFRDPSKGGWPFSTRSHGWPISDCTSEGLRSALDLALLVSAPIAMERLVDTVDLILFFQNPDGGWPTYEKIRGTEWLEALNPSNIFGEIMVDYSHIECSASCILALVRYLEAVDEPPQNLEEITKAIARGKEFILKKQRPDGGWEGFWGVCFTYGGWFALAALKAAGVQKHHPAVERGCKFIQRYQLEDGGWGEHPNSSRDHRYVSLEKGHATQTAWAVLALIDGGQGDSPAVKRGLESLRSTQRGDGTWERRFLTGLFNRTCGINYPNYEQIFPLWALGCGEAFFPEQTPSLPDQTSLPAE